MRRPTHYHKGYTREEQAAVERNKRRETRAVQRDTDVRSKTVIAWDGEGMKLSGPDKPQHYVLFGCSVRPDDPLVITEPHGRLTFEEIADYCCDVAAQYPNAIHLGYFFSYDQNMIIWSLPWPVKQTIYNRNSCRIRRNGKLYIVKLIPGKTLRITRIGVDGRKASILIEDIAAFFSCKFTDAYESLFPTPTDPENWAIVVEGKKARADMMYEDMPRVLRYWRAEIIALEELVSEFRRLMFEGGFMLTDWYGPGALANYIRRREGLVEHEYGGKEQNLSPEVHAAVKGAFFGGHIEQYYVGVVPGPIYQYDRNSAYPTGFCHVPSLAEGGHWEHVGSVSTDEWQQRRDLQYGFAVYRVRFRGRTNNREYAFSNAVMQPLPHRSKRGAISYPRHTEGWYWAPEVRIAKRVERQFKRYVTCEILDGWRWIPANDSYPWRELMINLYERRLRLKQNKNPVQMGFKLAMNSLYGKMAQRAGGKDKPPQSHTLPIAGFVTSHCRAAVMDLMHSCNPGSILTVETDGVFTTTPPEELNGNYDMGDQLGDWSMKVLDEMIILQNGVYLTRIGDEWLPPKSRGIPATSVNHDTIMEHLSKCSGSRWPKLKFRDKEAFIGLGAAISRATKVNRWGRRSTNPFKARALHCTWHAEPREVDLEGHNSKRIHIAKVCRQCKEGKSPIDEPHRLTINSEADRYSASPSDRASHSYTLPWEKEYKEERWRLELDKEGMFDVEGDR
jgi:hypothetical protein